MQNSQILKPLAWDSDFFGIRIAKATISDSGGWEELKRIPLDDYDLIYIFDETNSELCPMDSALLVDTKVIYRKSLSPQSGTIRDGSIHLYSRNTPDEDLYALALTSGKYSRYNLDPGFPAGSYERLYRRWIENSANGQMANAVLYYEQDGHKLGMLTLKLSETESSIGLIAVDDSRQGLGIGTKLIQSAEQYLTANGIATLDVATQMNNLPACSFYEKNGFTVHSCTRIYHLWMHRR